MIPMIPLAAGAFKAVAFLGVVLLVLTIVMVVYLDRYQKRQHELKKKEKEVEKKEVEATETLFEEETMDPIDRELEDE